MKTDSKPSRRARLAFWLLLATALTAAYLVVSAMATTERVRLPCAKIRPSKPSSYQSVNFMQPSFSGRKTLKLEPVGGSVLISLVSGGIVQDEGWATEASPVWLSRVEEGALLRLVGACSAEADAHMTAVISAGSANPMTLYLLLGVIFCAALRELFHLGVIRV